VDPLCRIVCLSTEWDDEGGYPYPGDPKLHSDGTSFDGWFVLGMFRAKGQQITYHLPMDRWKECEFAETLERAPEFDGHTAGDCLKRIASL